MPDGYHGAFSVLVYALGSRTGIAPTTEYVAKPFSYPELRVWPARLRRTARRPGRAAAVRRAGGSIGGRA